MDYYLQIRPEARADLLDAFYWYQAQMDSLGYDFKSCVDDAMSKIQENPTLYKIVEQNVRRAFIKKFPFGILYLTNNNTVVVLAVLHARRDPIKWKSRIL